MNKITLRQSGITATGWIVIGAIALLAIFVLIPALTGGQFSPLGGANEILEEGRGGITGEPQGDQTPAQPPTLDEIVNNTDNYIGQQVTVTGEVSEVLSANAMTIDEPGLFGESLIVVTQNPIPQINEMDQVQDDYIFQQGDRVRVTGTVRRFNLTDIENQIGTDLDDATFQGLENNPAVIATRVEKLQGSNQQDGTQPSSLQQNQTL